MKKIPAYRLIQQKDITVELSDPAIRQIHFIGEEVIVRREYGTGTSISRCNPRETSYFEHHR